MEFVDFYFTDGNTQRKRSQENRAANHVCAFTIRWLTGNCLEHEHTGGGADDKRIRGKIQRWEFESELGGTRPYYGATFSAIGCQCHGPNNPVGGEARNDHGLRAFTRGEISAKSANNLHAANSIRDATQTSWLVESMATTGSVLRVCSGHDLATADANREHAGYDRSMGSQTAGRLCAATCPANADTTASRVDRDSTATDQCWSSNATDARSPTSAIAQNSVVGSTENATVAERE